jgi:hypothetical protein
VRESVIYSERKGKREMELDGVRERMREGENG